MLIIKSESNDVYKNLAIEDYLISYATDKDILFLWQSECAVVIGKHQNPWMECRLTQMSEESVNLARRISGGGTVYHDAGNLNFCIITDRLKYTKHSAFNLICDTLKTYGLLATQMGQSNLCINDKKFSGNAFCFRKNRVMHHGTILVNANLMRLNRYLGSTYDSIKTHAIKSIPAEICNLSDLNNHITIPLLTDEIIKCFIKRFSNSSTWPETKICFEDHDLKAFIEKQQSDEWIYEATPSFSLTINGKTVEISRGRITKINGSTNHYLQGKTFHTSATLL